jgi:hypothetical protein
LEECLKEFYSTYDDTLVQWNGAELMTRVISNLSSKADENRGNLDIKLEPSVKFYPVSSTDIIRYDFNSSIWRSHPFVLAIPIFGQFYYREARLTAFCCPSQPGR